MKSPHSGLNRIFYAFGYSWKGLKATWQHEAAFKQEALLFLLLLPVAIWLGSTLLEQVLLIAVWLLVLMVEIINSAIESVVDRFGEEFHELSGRAKDQGSAAVLLSIIIAVSVWLAVIAMKVMS